MAIHKIVYSVKRGVCVDVKDVFYETQRKQIECGVQSFAGLCVDCCYLFLTAFYIVQSNMYKKKLNTNNLYNSEWHFRIQNYI